MWIILFIYLFGALYLFERKRIQLDWFQVLVVALAPAILEAIMGFVSMLVELPPIVDLLMFVVTLVVVYLLLWKMMGVTSRRSLGYVGGLLVFIVVFSFGVVALVGQP